MDYIYYLYPLRTFLVVAGSVEKPNAMTADWVTPLSFTPPLLGVSIGHKRYTKKLIEDQGDFVISVPTLELLRDVWIAGTVSGAKVNKAEMLSVNFVESKSVKAPSIRECQANLECKLVNQVEAGDHTFFIGEIVNVSYGDAFKEKPDIGNYKFIMHLKGRDFTTNSSEIYNP